MNNQIKLLGGDTIAVSDVSGGLPDRSFRDAWKLNGNAVEVDMATAKASAQELRRKWRDHVDTQTFPYDFGSGPVLFNKDMKSVSRIIGAVQMATIQDAMHDADPNIPAFATAWTDSTGNDHAANKAWIVGLFMAMGQHTQSVHTDNGVKWQAIEDAADAAALKTIVDAMKADMGE